MTGRPKNPMKKLRATAGVNLLGRFGVLASGRRNAVTHKILQERRMKAIRIATLAFALCAGLTSVAAAQGQPEPQGQGEMRRGGGMGGMLLKDITLTDAQKDQIKTIREKYMPQQMELRKSAQATGGPPDQATMSKMMDLQEKQAAEIRGILTADQQKVFDGNLKEMRDRMEARRKGSS
jgi:Spy/CpxP family protein refolding chaperone